MRIPEWQMRVQSVTVGHRLVVVLSDPSKERTLSVYILA